MDYSETIDICDLKPATDDRSDKKFQLTSKLCPLGGSLLPTPGLYVLNHEKMCITSEGRAIF